MYKRTIHKNSKMARLAMSRIPEQYDYADEIKLVELEKQLLKGSGPNLVGVAATNTPHIRFRDQEITIVEKNGEKLLRIPILRKGIFSYRGTKIPFTDAIFNKIIDNHNNQVGDYAPSMNKNHTRGEALAWFHNSDFAGLKVEGPFLVGYAKPTGDDVIEAFEKGKYLYASAEVDMNYQSNAIKLDFEDGKFEELEMTDLKYSQEDGKYVFEESAFKEIQDAYIALEEASEKLQESDDKLAQLQTKIDELNTQLEELKAAKNSDNNKAEVNLEDLSEDVRTLLENAREATIKLEAENKRLRLAGLQSKVDNIIANAEKPVDGKVHDRVILEFARAIMLGNEIGEGDNVIKLEDSNDFAAYVNYVRAAVPWLLENTQRVIPVDTNDNDDDLDESPLTTTAKFEAADFDGLLSEYDEDIR